MFIIYFHTLLTVNFLYFIHDKHLCCFNTFGTQNVVRIQRTAGKGITTLYYITFMHDDPFSWRDHIFLFGSVFSLYIDHTTGFCKVTNSYCTHNLGEYSLIFGHTCFK